MLESVLALKELDAKAFDAAGPASAPQHDTADTITVPDAHLLFNGEFKRVGTTGLKITGEDGQSFFIQDYFSGEKHKHLLSPEGAMLSAHVVGALAGPLAPGQMAQAGAQPATQPVVGRVDAISGSCTVVRNGVTVSLNMGDNVRKGDVVQTSGSSAISIVFTDGSTFSLSANARMVLDEFVYNAGGTNNSAMINLVQGTFSFVAGQVAKTGDMRVETPVATIGIRGTAVLVEISANDGQTKFSVMVEPNGVTGSFNLYNKTTGALMATVNNSQVGWLVTPAGPLQVVAQAINKTPAELQQELGIVQQLFNIFNNYQQNPIDPNQTQDPSQRGDNTGPQNTGSIGSGGGPSSNQPPNYTVTITQIPNGNTPPPQNPQNPQGPTNPNAGGNPNPTTPDSPTGGLPTVPLPTGTFNVINGTTGDDHITGTPGNDIVYAGSGNDLITAGHGGGDDIYDGGTDHDKIEFPSSTADITFHLNVANRTLDGGEVVKESTADGAQTGHDIFFRIEEVVGGQGNDTFVLHDTGNWKLDGGAGNDTVKLDGNVSIRDGATTLELSNIEIIDLNTTHANVIDLDVKTVIDANEDHVLVINGNSQDAVNFLNVNGQNGHWELVADTEDPDYRPGYDMYRFVPEYYWESGEDPTPTVYVQQGINTDGVAGGPIQDHIIENVWVTVNDPEGYALSNETIIPDLLNATVEDFGNVWGTATVLLSVQGKPGLYYQITGDFSFVAGESFAIKGGNVTGLAIGTLEGGNFTASHAYSSGFNFSAVDFFNALQSDDFITLNSFLSSASYDFWGGDGADILVGSDFRDTLRGGEGNDILTGNGGPDVFIYSAGSDTITDFTIGSDKIDLTAFNYIHSMADIGPRAHYDSETGNTTIDFGDGNLLVLQDVDLNDLSNSDFVFFTPEPLEELGTNEGHNDSSSMAYKVLGPNGGSTSFVAGDWTGAAQNGGHSYLFVSENVAWTAARAAALAMGGYLTNITSEGENTFVYDNVTHGSFSWIGASDRYVEGNWVWADGPEAGTMFWQGNNAENGGAPVGGNYNGWWENEPNNLDGEDYAFIDHNGVWTDVPNSYEWMDGYVVEFSGQVFTKAGMYGTAVFNATTGILTYALNDNDTDTQALADGQTVTETFDLTFMDSNNQTVTRTATFTIHGTNDAPEFVLTEGDSTSETFAEAHADLSASGTLHAFDVDAGSNLTVSITDVDADGITGLSEEDLLGFFHASAPDADGKITWTFDSGDEAFGGIAPGQYALLHYTVRVRDEHDSSHAQDEQIVTIRIDNNHAPEALDTVSYGNDYQGAMDITLAATDDSPTLTFSLQNLSNLLTLGEFSENGFSTVLSENELQTLTAYSNDGSFSKTIQFRPFEEGEYSFSFTATDDLGRSSTGSVFASNLDGDNEINAGPGNQLINGGQGQDTFIFSQGDGKDIIANMTIGSLTNPQADIIWLEDIDSDQVDVIDVGGYMRITIGPNQWIDLAGVSYSEENKNLLLEHNLQYPAVI